MLAARESLLATPGSLYVKLRGCQGSGTAALTRTVPCRKDTEVKVTDFYGIQAGTIPGFAWLAAGIHEREGSAGP